MVSSAKPTVVVVDDDEIILQQVRDGLETAGFRVITRSRAIGCVALTLQEGPALVLLDVGMPGVGGDTLVKLLMSAAPKRKTIVLLYSGLSEAVLAQKAELSGADGYIRKSSDVGLLVRQVNQWLGPRSDASRQRSAATSSERKPSAPPVSAASERTPHVLFVDDDMLMLSAYRRLMQSTRMNVEFALSGTHAMNWIRSSDPPDVVVCDLMMAPPAGDEVYVRAVAADPMWQQRFIFVTGSSDARQKLGHNFVGPLLPKPLNNDALLDAIQRCLRRGVLSRAPGAAGA